MPTKAAPKLKTFARRLVSHQAQDAQGAGKNASGSFQVCEALRRPLGTVLGAAGYQALLTRALALAGEEVSWLRKASFNPNGSLEVSNEMRNQMNAEDSGLAEVVLVARLLELLITFIGPVLTLGLIQDVWPKAVRNDMDI